jgi:hypothetical protein
MLVKVVDQVIRGGGEERKGSVAPKLRTGAVRCICGPWMLTGIRYARRRWWDSVERGILGESSCHVLHTNRG